MGEFRNGHCYWLGLGLIEGELSQKPVGKSAPNYWTSLISSGRPEFRLETAYSKDSKQVKS